MKVFFKNIFVLMPKFYNFLGFIPFSASRLSVFNSILCIKSRAFEIHILEYSHLLSKAEMCD